MATKNETTAAAHEDEWETVQKWRSSGVRSRPRIYRHKPKEGAKKSNPAIVVTLPKEMVGEHETFELQTSKSGMVGLLFRPMDEGENPRKATTQGGTVRAIIPSEVLPSVEPGTKQEIKVQADKGRIIIDPSQFGGAKKGREARAS